MAVEVHHQGGTIRSKIPAIHLFVLVEDRALPLASQSPSYHHPLPMFLNVIYTIGSYYYQAQEIAINHIFTERDRTVRMRDEPV